MKANEIIALAQRDAKAIRLGSREYSNEILMQLDIEIEKHLCYNISRCKT